MSASRIIAVIGFSNATSPLLPLWPTTHRAMLPVAGKSLIVHHIERLASAGVTHIRIAGSVQQYAVRKRIGDGSEWGVNIRYSDLHGPDLRNECVMTSGECLYLLGDQLLALPVDDVLAERAANAGLAADDATAPGIYRFQGGKLVARHFTDRRDTGGFYSQLNNPADYLQANIEAASGAIDSLVLPGLLVHEAAVADWHAQIDSTAYVGAGVVVGKHSHVRATARLENNVVLSNGVIVDRGACLENVVVLPNTWVSSALQLRDAIVGPDGVMDLDGTFYPAATHKLVGKTRSAREQKTGIPGQLPGMGRPHAWLGA